MPAEPTFWIDVGGTFTDCLVRWPDGRLDRHKLLSSGRTPGTIASVDPVGGFRDPARRVDPPDFWRAAPCTLYDADGRLAHRTSVAAFDAATGELTLAEPPPQQLSPGQRYELGGQYEAPVVAIRWLLGLPGDADVPPVRVRLGTTRGTNALLTRRGARTVLATTRGLADAVRIGYQNRPELFARSIRLPPPLYEHVVEIDERIAADGQIVQAIDEAAVRRVLAELPAAGFDSLAVCLMHATRFPEHERLIGRVARSLGFAEVSLSHEVSAIAKLVPRADTTLVDAYLNPVLRDYIARLEADLPGSSFRLMTSAGGLVAASEFTGKDSLLSGPAGGTVGMARVAQANGFTAAIGFDMGGTSTDVSRWAGQFPLDYESQKAGVRIAAPMMAIETVAAGGGSICRFDGIKLVVGPASAGADPGPACYGRGGPLCVTDLNVWLGRVPAERFPFPLDLAAVEARLSELAEQLRQAGQPTPEADALAEGLLRVANANMVEAIRSVSLAKGYDPRDHVLVAFGGAANQHACAVARELGIRQVLNHPDAGLLSAVGMGLAPMSRHHAASLQAACTSEVCARAAELWAELAERGRHELRAEGVEDQALTIVPRLEVRYAGLDQYLTLDVPTDELASPERLAAWARRAYEAEHHRRFGYIHNQRALECGAVRVEVVAAAAEVAWPSLPARGRPLEPAGWVAASLGGRRGQVPWYDRAELAPGDSLAGPAIIAERVSTTVLEPGWQAVVRPHGELLLTDLHDSSAQGETDGLTSSVPADAANRPDPVLLEVLNNRFAGIAEQMGIALRHSASSVNVKERLDFSCALFTADGRLVVNAPHIPVHLGAMGLTVRHLLAEHPHLASGDVYVTNDPYRGGSHLPDVTVITPVFDTAGQELLFFTASRAHHAELGGIQPGSMPPFSTNLAEEGVLIANFRLIAAGQPHWQAFRELLTGGPYPSRRVEDNLADTLAQVAANQRGATDLLQLIDHYGWPTIRRYMEFIQQAAADKLRQVLRAMPDGTRRFADHLDDGSTIAVAITIHGDSATIDFTGTDPVVAGNLNANAAIVNAAVLYTLRVLLDEPIPLNEGVLDPVRIVLPECLLNPRPGPTPESSPAVVGGNVETSQRIVDVLFGALQLAAASQGTMNNLTFGDATFGYYETICGGSGATADWEGADAVQTHMTNTRLTDPEVLEARFPVRLEAFAIRAGSGGGGRQRGGHGVRRHLTFLRALDVAILAQRRGDYPPYGLAGGAPGAVGRHTRVHADGQQEPLAGSVRYTAAAGEGLIIETPGGGGFGPPGA